MSARDLKPDEYEQRACRRVGKQLHHLCPHCFTEHVHGLGDGHRAPHCKCVPEGYEIWQDDSAVRGFLTEDEGRVAYASMMIAYERLEALDDYFTRAGVPELARSCRRAMRAVGKAITRGVEGERTSMIEAASAFKATDTLTGERLRIYERACKAQARYERAQLDATSRARLARADKLRREAQQQGGAP